MIRIEYFVVALFSALVLVRCSSNDGDNISDSEPIIYAIDSLFHKVSESTQVSQKVDLLETINELSYSIDYGEGVVKSNILMGGILIHSEPNRLLNNLSILDSIMKIEPSSFSKKSMFRYFSLKGMAYNIESDATNELMSYLAADSIAHESDDVHLILNSYGNLKNYYFGKGNYTVAIKYAKRGLTASEGSDDRVGRFYHASSLTALGLFYNLTDNPDSSIVFTKRAMAATAEFPILIGNQHLILARAYLKQNELDSAEKHADLADIHLLKDADLSGTLSGNILQGELRLKNNDFEGAIGYLNPSIEMADSIKNLNAKIESERLLIRALLQKAGYDDDLVVDLETDTDSLQSIKLEEQHNEIAAKYETKKKEQHIAELSLRNSRKNVIVWATFLVAFITSLLLIYRHRASKRLLQEKIANERLENELLNFDLEKAIEKAKDQVSTINRLKQDLQNSSSDLEVMNEMTSLLDQNYVSDIHWSKILYYFDALNDSFTEKIKVKFPNLTKNDIRLLVLIKSSYSNKAISEVKNISESSVKKSKQRMLAKLNLSSLDEIVV